MGSKEVRLPAPPPTRFARDKVLSAGHQLLSIGSLKDLLPRAAQMVPSCLVQTTNPQGWCSQSPVLVAGLQKKIH